MKKLGPPPRALGSVHRDEVLRLNEFGRRMGLAQRALADAQRRGLRTILFGRTKFVLGVDVLEFFEGLRNCNTFQKGENHAG